MMVVERLSITALFRGGDDRVTDPSEHDDGCRA